MQERLNSLDAISVEFPTTRYQGSKRELRHWVFSHIRDHDPDSLLEPFAGTCAVGFEAKRHRIQTTVSDVMPCNHMVGKGLIENNGVTLDKDDIETILRPRDDHPSVIEDEFAGIYFTDEENRWLDRVVTNIREMDGKYLRALAYISLFQACLKKRPYNLFHRANLDMRTKEVERSFGNKTTWDRPFEETFRSEVPEVNAAVHDNGRENRAFCSDVFDLDATADMVYCDPPYLRSDGRGTDYRYFYHFLNGILDYENWRDRIDRSVKTKRLETESSVWTDEDSITDAFHDLFDQYEDTTLALSYNTDGIPSVDELVEMMEARFDTVELHRKDHTYALREREEAQEILLIGHS